MLLLPEIPLSDYFPSFLTPEESKSLLKYCLESLPWEQKNIRVYGKSFAQPRLQYWMSDQNITYRYSDLTLESNPWHPPILTIKSKIEEITAFSFNSALINLYRDGEDSMGWHADDETSLGNQPVIASLSIGAARDFQIKSKSSEKNDRYNLSLTDGSLFIMQPGFQSRFVHALPKRKRCSQPRINLTFRHIVQQF